jgi:hypothetical protein
MLQARDAVSRRSWSHPQEPTGEEWWADVLADPRVRKRERRTDLAVKQAFYRLADEKREIMLVACSKCDWRAAFARDELIAAHGQTTRCPIYSIISLHRVAAGSGLNGIAVACTTSSPSKRTRAVSSQSRETEGAVVRQTHGYAKTRAAAIQRPARGTFAKIWPLAHVGPARARRSPAEGQLSAGGDGGGRSPEHPATDNICAVWAASDCGHLTPISPAVEN